MKKFKEEFLPLTLLFFWGILLFFEAICLKGIFFGGDIRSNEFQLRWYAAQVLKSGRFPLWEPKLMCGYPIFADYMTGIYHPISIGLFYFLPGIAALNYFIIFHYLLASISCYLFSRTLGVSKIGSFLSGLLYGFGGQMLVKNSQSTSLSAVAYLPLILLFIELGLEKKKTVYIVLAALAICLSILGGNPQRAIIIWLFSLAYTIFNFLEYFGANKRAFYKLVRILLLVILLPLGITAIQWIPLSELSKFSFRYSLPYEQIVYASFKPQYFITLIYPFFYGRPYECILPEKHHIFAEANIYIGVITLFLVGFAFAEWQRKRLIKFLSWSSIVATIIAFGKYTPVYKILYFLPVLKTFRAPARWMIIPAFSLAILAGFGFDRLEKNKRYLTLFEQRCAKEILIIIGTILIIALLTVFSSGKTRALFLQAISGENFYSAHLLGQTLFLLLGALLINLYLWHRISKKIFQISVCLAIALDIFIFSSVLKTDHNRAVEPEICLNAPATVRWLKKYDPSPYYRVYGFTNKLLENYEDIPEMLALLRRFTGLYYGLSCFQCYGPSNTLRFFKYLGDLEMPEIDLNYKINLLDKKAKILGLANVKYILSKEDLPEHSFTLIANVGVKIYRNKYFLPRFFIVQKAKVFSEPEKILDFLHSSEFNPLEVVAIENFPKSILISLDSTNNKKISFTSTNVQLLKYTEEQIVLKTTLPSPAFLFLSDYFYPGWKVFVDKKLNKIYRANYLFKAVFLDKGEHIIEFIFRPASFILGAIISIISIMGTSVLILCEKIF